MTLVSNARRLVVFVAYVCGLASSGGLPGAPGERDAGDLCSDGPLEDVTEEATTRGVAHEGARECSMAMESMPRRDAQAHAAFQCADEANVGVCAAPSEWTVGLVPSALGPVDSESVRRIVEALTQTARGRAAFGAALHRSGRYRRDVVAALGAKHLPADLEAVVLVESAYLPRATSIAGARGLWQLMPATARNLGLRVDGAVDERRSVRLSSDAATQHLADLFATFGNWELALAAYNFGAGRVLERMRRTGAMSFAALASESGTLPRETRDYVPQVLAVSVVLRNLAHFGFDASECEHESSSSLLDVPGGTSLRTLARACATSVQVLRDLNPAIDGLDGAPPDATTFSIEIPAGSLGRARAMLPALLATAEGTPPPPVPDDFDWGAEGDVRAAIAATHGERVPDRSGDLAAFDVLTPCRCSSVDLRPLRFVTPPATDVADSDALHPRLALLSPAHAGDE